MRVFIALALVAMSFPLWAGAATVRGYWVEPHGSVLRIDPCANRLCVEIVAVGPHDHDDLDVHNPDPALRRRPLCGLRIGADFIERDPHHADGGHIYDPRSGRTYRGSMTTEGDQLKLHGFVGIELFGGTVTWTRAREIRSPCPPAMASLTPRRRPKRLRLALPAKKVRALRAMG